MANVNGREQIGRCIVGDMVTISSMLWGATNGHELDETPDEPGEHEEPMTTKRTRNPKVPRDTHPPNPGKFWTTREGDLVPIREMEDSHLENALRMLDRLASRWRDQEIASSYGSATRVPEAEDAANELANEPFLDAKAFAAGPVIVAAHMTVPGASLGSESKEMARGRDLDLPVDSIAALRPRYVFNGHYHRAQVVPGPVPVIIPGSPWRVTFGEAGDIDKGFLVVEV